MPDDVWPSLPKVLEIMQRSVAVAVGAISGNMIVLRSVWPGSELSC